MKFSSGKRRLLLLEHYLGDWRRVPTLAPGREGENHRLRTATCTLVTQGLLDQGGETRARLYRTTPKGEQELIRIRAALAAGVDPRWWPNGYPKNRRPYSYGKRTKLTESDVRAAREERARLGTPWVDLAKRFGVSDSTIICAVTGKTWRHL